MRKQTCTSGVGGKTIVDATSMGIGRDPLGLARIARATGLSIRELYTSLTLVY